MAMHDPDRDWKPNNRPQSTMARNFSAALDDLFKIDGDLDTLDRTVHQKKQAVTGHQTELEALEAKLRETEERLKQVKSSPPNFSRKNSQRRTPIEGTFAEAERARAQQQGSPLAKENQRPRLETAKSNPPIPGGLPETPTSTHTTREYVMVDRPRAGQSNRQSQADEIQE